jgi:polyhydroxyalkanoate synthesis regulator phasin
MDINSSTAPASAEALKRPPCRGLLGTTRDLALASIGIAGVLGDEAQALYRRSVERGGGTVRKAQDRFKRVSNPRRWHVRPAGKRSRHSKPALEELEAVLARLNVPSAADIDALSQQIGELEAKINQLTNK